MFKPHKGICKCHEKERWIINKKGLCQYGVREAKEQAKRDSGRNTTKKRSFNRSGDGSRQALLRRIPKGNSAKQQGSKRSPENSKVKVNDSLAKKARKPIKYRRRATGEAEIFREIFEAELQKNETECPKCQCCGTSLGNVPDVRYFSHILSKGSFPAFRTWRLNILLCCVSCHAQWEFGDRTASKFHRKRYIASILKRYYYLIFYKLGIKNGYERLPASLEEVQRIIEAHEAERSSS